ncbi:MAG TPA: hypothetical protein VER03_15735 [Bryobacteraceae bacterium]|nr:hypothetical protein [Bryobacteraceae bacterium]
MQDSTARTRITKSSSALLIRLGGLLAFVLLTTEIFWRLAGWGPAINDIELWMATRARVNNDSNAVVLLGSSRVLCGLHPDVLNRELLGYRTYSLAVSGADPMPVLEDLARDTKFRGTVVCENVEAQGFERYPFRQLPRPLEFAQSPLPDAFKKLFYFASAQLTSRRNSAWGLMSTLGQAGQTADTTTASRFVPLRYTAGDAVLQRRRNRVRLLERYQTWKRQAPYSTDESVLAQVPKWVAQIRARGGNVVFVRMPTGGDVQRLSASLYGEYAKQFATQFKPYVDCDNEPALKGFASTDESHLDADAALEFSVAFARTLRERNLVGSSAIKTASRRR